MVNEHENFTSAEGVTPADSLENMAQEQLVAEKTAPSEIVDEAGNDAETAIQTDFSAFDKAQIVDFAENLFKTAQQKLNFKQTDTAFKAMRERVDAFFNEDREAALLAFKANAENPEEAEEGFEFKKDEQTLKFEEIYRNFRKFRDEHYRKQEEDKNTNLKTKRRIIEDIKNLIEKVEGSEKQNGRGDFDAIKKLQEEWKTAGPVPQNELDDLNKSYRATLDRFYQQKKMEKEMLEYGLNKNLEAKLDICKKAEELGENENINEAVKLLNELHKKFKQIGAVPKDKQEEVWDRFKAASDKIYDKKRSANDDFKKILEDNMKLKQELCLKVEVYIDFKSDRIKEWNEKTKEILDLQTAWEAVGPAPKEVSKGLNKHFWKNFKTFFENKSKFFESLEGERKTNLKAKEALCERAEAAKASNDWDAATETFKELQEEWKKIGPAPDNVSDQIFERFKKACDEFFERKRNRRNIQDKEFSNNFEAKAAVCKEIEALTAGTPALPELEKLVNKWNEIGFVPRKQIGEAQDAFTEAVDACLDKINPDNKTLSAFREKHNVRMSSKTFKTVKKKETSSSKRISALENDINLWQNNIAFFAKSKNADALRNEYDAKIKAAKAEIDVLKKELAEGK